MTNAASFLCLRRGFFLEALEARRTPAAFTVNSLLDDSSGSGNTGTLRYCIGLANTQTGDDTIDFSVTGTINLANGQLTLTDTAGKTTIAGPGAALLAIDGKLKSRVFEISSSAKVELSGVTLTNGKEFNGGGIRNNGTLAVTMSTLSGNSASSRGGGLYSPGTATLTNCTFNSNWASFGGGGAYNLGMATLTNCTLSGNSATSGGGGVHNRGTAILTNSTLSGNSAGSRGGGIYNQAYATLTVTNSTLSSNSAGSRGGGIFNNSPSTLTVMTCTFSGNFAGSRGGGVYNRATTTLTDCTLSGNSANNGGGLYSSGSGAMATLTNCTLTGNAADNGGGFYNRGASKATLTNCTLSGNTANFNGGGINNLGTLTLTNSTVSGNSASASNAGGIYSYTPLHATNTIVAGNTGGNVSGSLATNINNLLNISSAAAGLGVLGIYGGLTQTLPLLPGSPAINAGTATGGPATDQRGLPRVGAVDIGSFEVQVLQPAKVANVSVNGGADQRSRVTLLAITFDHQVSLAGQPVDAFLLQRQSDGKTPALSAVIDPTNTIVTLTFLAGDAVESASLADGRYTLIVNAAKFGSDGFDGDGAGGNYVLAGNTTTAPKLFRYYGDSDGDGDVDNTDFIRFRGTFNVPNNQPAYLAYFDFDGDGDVDNTDFLRFRQRFNQPLP